MGVRPLPRPAYLAELAAPCLAVLLLLVAYLPGLHAPFYMDDELQILYRPGLRPGPGRLWETSLGILAREGVHHRGLAYLSFYWNRLLAGDDPFGFRVVNLIFHAGSFLLLYSILRRLARDDARAGTREERRFPFLALGAAALWAVNPVNIQSVTYVVQRMTGVMTFFCLASVRSFLSGCDAMEGGKRALHFALAALFMGLSLGFKENAVLIPYFLLLAWWLRGAQGATGGGQRSRAPSGMPGRWAIGGLAAWTALLFWEWVRLARALPSPEGISWAGHWMTAARVVPHFAGLFFLPAPSRLHLNYDIQPSTGLFSPIATFGGVLLIAAWVAAIVLLRKRDRWIAFGLAWALLGIIPESLLPSLDLAFEHRLYLPSIGLAVAACRILSLPAESPPRREAGAPQFRPWLFPGSLVVIFALWSAWTWERNGVWADPGRFIRHEWTLSPRHPRTIGGMMHHMLGERRFREAIDLGESALRRRHKPLDEAVLRNNLALAYGGSGDWGTAARLLERTVLSTGGTLFDLYNLGVAYYESGRRELAAQRFEEVLATDPYHPDANFWLGKVRRGQGREREAIALYETALLSRPSDREVERELLDSHIAMEDWRRASGVLERMQADLRSPDPESIELLGRAGLVELKIRRLDRAEEAYRLYLHYVPGDAVARYNLACVLSLKGDVRGSLATLKDLLSTGFRDRALFADPDLDGVRQDPGFPRLVAQYGIRAGSR